MLDISAALPLTVGDWREVQKRGASMKAMIDGGDLEASAIIVQYVLDKAKTGANVDALSLRQLSELMRTISNAESDGEIDRPT